MVMPRKKNAGQSHNITADNTSFERVETVQIFENNPNISQFYSGRNLRTD